MSRTCYTQLIVGFPVQLTDIYTLTRAPVATCSKGHPRPTQEAKFCAEDGSAFVFQETEVPTAIGLEMARRYNWASQVKSWRDEVSDRIGWNSFLLNAARYRGDEGNQHLVVGEVLDEIRSGERSGNSVKGFNLNGFTKAVQRVSDLRAELGFSPDRTIELFLSLYESF